MKEPKSNIGVVCREHAPRPNPKFFEMPLEYFRGKYVKLAFHPVDSTGVKRTEHLWVDVSGILVNDLRGELRGVLDSDSVFDPMLCEGVEVIFDRTEIEDVFVG